MTSLIEVADIEATRGLILSMSGGKLSESDLEALRFCTSMASNLWIGYIDAKAVCTWGLVPPTILSDGAYLWLYSDPEIKEHKFTFIRQSQIVIEDMLKLYPLIYGVTRITGTHSIRWLRWLGAVFGEPHNGFLPFEIRRP